MKTTTTLYVVSRNTTNSHGNIASSNDLCTFWSWHAQDVHPTASIYIQKHAFLVFYPLSPYRNVETLSKLLFIKQHMLLEDGSTTDDNDSHSCLSI
jgi:hypothetical protein